MTTLVSKICTGFNGQVVIPGDKSISHRALILAALAPGVSRIEGLLEAEDVLNTKVALEAIGATITKTRKGYEVRGCGPGSLAAPKAPLDFGNSGTGARLMMGLLAAYSYTVEYCGDASLAKRPMARVLGPLSEMGVVISPKGAATLPLTMTGSPDIQGIDYISPVASAQVKSAILLAGLGVKGKTSVTENTPTRDHTERLLLHFGAKVQTQSLDNGAIKISLKGHQALAPQDLAIPGDISAAAFPLVAGLVVPGAKVAMNGLGVNPLRTGLLDVLMAMGANIRHSNRRAQSGEPVADLQVAASRLKAVRTSADIAPRMIDEFPILFVAAALADGVSEFQGLGELRLKESDRLQTMAQGLRANGVEVDEIRDGLIITGANGLVPGGGTIDAGHDHRIAMAFLILGMRAKKPITVTGAESISTSFPGFAKLMAGLGATIEETA